MAYSGGAGIPTGGGGNGGPPAYYGGKPQGVTSRPPKPPRMVPPILRFGPGNPPPPGLRGLRGGQAPPPSLDPRDATYYMNVGQNQFDTNNRINALNLQGATAGTNLQAALAQLAYQQPRDSLRLEQQANARGALYSTPFQQQQGDLSNSYLQRQGADITGFQQGVAGRAAQVSALEGGEGLYALQQALAASLRASQRAARNPAQGEPLGKPGAHGPIHPGNIIHPRDPRYRGGFPHLRGPRRPPSSGGAGLGGYGPRLHTGTVNGAG